MIYAQFLHSVHGIIERSSSIIEVGFGFACVCGSPGVQKCCSSGVEFHFRFGNSLLAFAAGSGRKNGFCLY